MVEIEIVDWEGFEKYIKDTNPKELKVQLEHQDKTATIRIIADDVTSILAK